MALLVRLEPVVPRVQPTLQLNIHMPTDAVPQLVRYVAVNFSDHVSHTLVLNNVVNTDFVRCCDEQRSHYNVQHNFCDEHCSQCLFMLIH